MLRVFTKKYSPLYLGTNIFLWLLQHIYNFKSMKSIFTNVRTCKESRRKCVIPLKRHGDKVKMEREALVQKSGQTSFKALKRNESCGNEEIKNKNRVCICNQVCKSSPDGFFKNLWAQHTRHFISPPHHVITIIMWSDAYRGFLQLAAVHVSITPLEMFCIIQTGLKPTYGWFLHPVWRIIGVTPGPLGSSDCFRFWDKLTFPTRANAGHIVSTMTGTELTGVCLWNIHS